jgi:hypothetical protein
MSKPSSASSSDPPNNSLIVVAMLAMIAVPAGIALHTVRIPAPTQIPPANATPYGYTVSLLLFIIPIIVIGWWFDPQEGIKILVGLPAAANDGFVRWSVGWAADRGRVCLDRSHLRDSDCFRSHQTLAGFGEAFERRVFRRARSPVEKDASGR